MSVPIQSGAIKKGSEIGYKDDLHKYIYHLCFECGKGYWTRLFNIKRDGGSPSSLRCRACACRLLGERKGEDSSFWKGGRNKTHQGYIRVWVSENDFFAPMRDTHGHVAEHRLVMAKSLGRCLSFWELVHHKNGVKDDNRLENLELTTKGSHMIEHNRGYRDGYLKGLVDGHSKAIKDLQSRVTILEAENILLKSHTPCEGRVLK